MTDGKIVALAASSECPICGANTPHEHTVIDRALFWKIEPVAKALCAAMGHDWTGLPDEWLWPTGLSLCRDFFRWQARFALDLVRPRDRHGEPSRNEMPIHGGEWPLSELGRFRMSDPAQPTSTTEKQS